ncbi:MAG: cysteine desulfurase family protein [Rhodothermales bacterium]
MKETLYLDYNASTPVDERVVKAMLPYFSEHFGNPSSKGHPYGWTADEACEVARERLADAIDAETEEIVFTSGATEAVNTAVKGVASAYESRGRHLVTVQTEHRAVLNAHKALERRGYEVTYLSVDTEGRVDLNELEDALRDDTVLVSVMWANNEVGTIHPIEEIAAMVRPRGILLMTDATQAVGKVPVSVEHVDLLACSAHKFYGPKGVGALFARRRGPRVRFTPLLDGGGHEDGRRSGTLNVPGIVGLGAAVEIAGRELPDFQARMLRLRDRLEAGLSKLPNAYVNVRDAVRLPQTTSIRFEGAQGNNVMMAARDLAFSAGSACSSGDGKPSHVLTAMGLTGDQSLSTLRISLGRGTTEEDVDRAVERLAEAVTSLREKSAATAT